MKLKDMVASSSPSEVLLRSIEYPEGASVDQIQELSAERRALYASAVIVDGGGSEPFTYSAALPGLDQGDLTAVLCDNGGKKVQHLVHTPPGGSPEVLMLKGKIFAEDLSPTQMVEYKFADSGWMLSGMGRGACEAYRGHKWGNWLDMWNHPFSKAALVQMVKAGLVNHLFDAYVLPSPKDELPKLTVVHNTTGKVTRIAHPVAALRVWDADKGAYQEISPVLDGAPQDADVASFWKAKLDELRAKNMEFDGEVVSGNDLVEQALQ